MRKIRLTKAANQATIVEVFANDVLDATVVVNNSIDFYADSADGNIQFLGAPMMESFSFNVNNLHADTVTLLTSPADSYDLVTKMAAQNFFYKS